MGSYIRWHCAGVPKGTGLCHGLFLRKAWKNNRLNIVRYPPHPFSWDIASIVRILQWSLHNSGQKRVFGHTYNVISTTRFRQLITGQVPTRQSVSSSGFPSGDQRHGASLVDNTACCIDPHCMSTPGQQRTALANLEGSHIMSAINRAAQTSRTVFVSSRVTSRRVRHDALNAIIRV